MAQGKSNNNLIKIVGLGVTVGGLAMYLTNGDNTVKPLTKPPASKSSAVKNGLTYLTSADYTYTPQSFAPVDGRVQDRFVPLVYKAGPATLNGPAISTNELTIPGNFTGGEPNWAFTGVVDVNGKRSALVENDTSGQSEYVHQGQKWKSSRVAGITENLLILRDVSGAQKKVQMQADVQAEIAKEQADLAELKVNAVATTPTVVAPTAPLDPGLVGAIGSGTTVQADPNAAPVAAAAAPMTVGRGGRRRGGRGGGRRGGRTGGG
ncbi:MAG: hypothetical protein ACYC96_12545 [Fimbriimonadaceae bacterium]